MKNNKFFIYKFYKLKQINYKNIKNTAYKKVNYFF